LKIIVYEHVSGGGYAEQPLQSEILVEGFGMLRAVVRDLKIAGHEVTVLLDARISRLNLPLNVDCTVPIAAKNETKKFLPKIAQSKDASYVIAPETAQTLQSIVHLMEQTGKNSLNSQSETIQKVADKTILYTTLAKNHLPTPETLLLNIDDSLKENKKVIKNRLNYPTVFKPTDGTSCRGLSIVKNEAQIAKALKQITTESSTKHFIVQEFISGQAASVSLLVLGSKALALSLNKQNIIFATPEQVSTYEGGVVPFEHHLKLKAFTAAKKAVECFPGLRGYVGVDLILSEDKPVVVDVNPRLTTSYIGLSKTANFNVAQAIVDTALQDKLPAKNGNRGFASFSKVETSRPTMNAFQKAVEMNEVVSPPFSIGNSSKACSMICGYADSQPAAELCLEEAKKHLLDIIQPEGTRFG
jgi:hypothetical protein